MDTFWKWLMRMDARGIFILSLLLLLLVIGWWSWVALRPPREHRALSAEAIGSDGSAPKLPPFRPLGVLGLVSNQFSADALIVPINPFRPTFEAMVSNQADIAIQDWQAGRTRDPSSQGRQPGLMTRIRIRTPRIPDGNTGTTGTPADPPPPTLTYRGMLQRPDGRIAAYLYDSAAGAGRFVSVGDTLHGVEVIGTRRGDITFKLANGEEQTLTRGDTIKLASGANP